MHEGYIRRGGRGETNRNNEVRRELLSDMMNQNVSCRFCCRIPTNVITMQEIKQRIDSHIEACKKLAQLEKEINKAGAAISDSLKKGGKLIVCGNGGSAADSQHFAAELVGRFVKERRPLPAIALTANSSSITAIGNDYSFAHVFERQVGALGKKDDVLFAISTSGNSENVIRAVKKANETGMGTIALLGKGGGKLKGMCRQEMVVPSDDTQCVQEMHIIVIHILCGIIEEAVGD